MDWIPNYRGSFVILPVKRPNRVNGGYVKIARDTTSVTLATILYLSDAEVDSLAAYLVRQPCFVRGKEAISRHDKLRRERDK